MNECFYSNILFWFYFEIWTKKRNLLNLNWKHCCQITKYRTWLPKFLSHENMIFGFLWASNLTINNLIVSELSTTILTLHYPLIASFAPHFRSCIHKERMDTISTLLPSLTSKAQRGRCHRLTFFTFISNFTNSFFLSFPYYYLPTNRNKFK